MTTPVYHPRLHTLRAVAFDLDGTLLDSLDDLADACNRTLLSAGFPSHPAEMYKVFVGDGVTQLVRRAVPERVPDAEIPGLVRKLAEDYSRNWSNRTRPYDGIAEALAALSEHGLRLAVLSNKPHEFTELMVKHFFPDIDWAVIAGARAGVPLKPDPAAALALCSELGLPPDQTALVGDSGMDMAAASGASLLAVGALWGFRDKAELQARGANLFVSEPKSLIHALIPGPARLS
jgi:phosphoglycolate phosphatase